LQQVKAEGPAQPSLIPRSWTAGLTPQSTLRREAHCPANRNEEGEAVIIEVSEVKVAPGRREAQEKHVRELAESISSVGLLNPITVDRGYTLIAGLHRLEAVKLLGWTQVECTVSTLEGLQAELAEIDENLIRHELNYLDEGEQLIRRKEIYEMLHPETRQGQRNGQTSKTAPSAVLETKPFAVDTAERTGQSVRTIREKIQVANNLTPETKEIVKKGAIGMKSALKISRLEAEKQAEAARQLASGTIHSLDEYQSASPEQEEPPKSTPDPEPDPEPEPLPQDAVPEVPPPPQDTGQGEASPPKRFLTFEDNVADLKDPNKDCSCTPDAFLAEISAYIRKFNHGMEWYTSPSYSIVFPELSQVQVKYLRELVDTVHVVLKGIIKQIEGSTRR